MKIMGTEYKVLESRVDEQCQLIMILKQHTHNATTKVKTLRQRNEELIENRDQCEHLHNCEVKKYNTLTSRFSDLSSNHHEMLSITDEYKQVYQDLLNKNKELKEENCMLFSSSVYNKDNQIQELKRNYDALNDKYEQLEIRYRKEKIAFELRGDSYKAKITDLKARQNQEIEQMMRNMQERTEKLNSTTLDLQSGNKNIINTPLQQKKLEELMAMRDGLLKTMMQKRKLIQEEQTQKKQLKKQAMEMEKEVEELKKQFQKKKCAVDMDEQVLMLQKVANDAKTEYQQTIKEFEIFKKKSKEMLQKERQINEKLRHLSG